MGNLCSQDPLSKPPFGKLAKQNISLLVTQCPRCFQIERPTKTRRTDFTGLDEQLLCRVQLLLLLLHTEPVFLRRVFHSPQIIFTEPHLWQACVNMRGFNCTRNLSSAQRWRVFSPRGGEKPEPLVFQGTEMFLTPLHTAPLFNCHRLSHRLSSNAIYRLSSSVLSTSMT